MAAPPAVGRAVRYQGVDKQSAGYQMLAAMGWKEGEGLVFAQYARLGTNNQKLLHQGAGKQGIKEHVKVKKKFDASGVGAVEAAAAARDWTTTMVAYDRVVSTLTEVTSQHASKRDDDSSSCSSEEDSDASGGEEPTTKVQPQAQLNTKKEVKQQSAKKRLKTSDTADALPKSKRRKPRSQDPEASPPADKSKKQTKKLAGVLNSTSAEEVSNSDAKTALVEAPAKRRVTFVGRFKRREVNKLVSNYSSTDLAAILGGTAGRTDEDDDAEAESDVAAEICQAPGTPPPAAEPPVTPSSAGTSDDDASQEPGDVVEADSAAEPVEGQWWTGYFVRAGRLGSMRRGTKPPGSTTAKVQLTGFTEDDQTNLYTLTQDGATHGKQGLGQSQQPKKVAGVRWAGTKMKLDSDDSDPDAGPEGESGGEESDEEGAGEVMIVAPKRAAKLGSTAALTGNDSGGGGAMGHGKGVRESGVAGRESTAGEGKGDGEALPVKLPKWKKLASRVLQESGKQQMSLKLLQKRVLKGLDLRALRLTEEQAREHVCVSVRKSQHLRLDAKGAKVSLTKLTK